MPDRNGTAPSPGPRQMPCFAVEMGVLSYWTPALWAQQLVSAVGRGISNSQGAIVAPAAGIYYISIMPRLSHK